MANENRELMSFVEVLGITGFYSQQRQNKDQ